MPVQHGPLRTKVCTWMRDVGDDLFLFVHGLGCSKRSWRDAWSRHELRDKSLLAIDLPGFGHSERPNDFSCALEKHAEVLAAVIDAYASRRIHMVAHSMGGSIALLLPQRTLARFERLSLIEPRLLVSSCGVASGSATVDFDQFRRETYPRFRKLAAADKRSAFDLERTELRAFYDSARSLQSWASGEELMSRFDRCPCPRYFIFGSENAHLEELKHIDDEFKVRIKDAGHFMMQDQPQRLYRELAA